jgi:hypothetical protein
VPKLPEVEAGYVYTAYCNNNRDTTVQHHSTMLWFVRAGTAYVTLPIRVSVTAEYIALYDKLSANRREYDAEVTGRTRQRRRRSQMPQTCPKHAHALPSQLNPDGTRAACSAEPSLCSSPIIGQLLLLSERPLPAPRSRYLEADISLTEVDVAFVPPCMIQYNDRQAAAQMFWMGIQ